MIFIGLLLIVICIPVLLHAQDPGGIDPAGDPDAPFDGGLSILIAAAIGYGIKKTKDFRKKKESLQESL